MAKEPKQREASVEKQDGSNGAAETFKYAATSSAQLKTLEGNYGKFCLLLYKSEYRALHYSINDYCVCICGYICMYMCVLHAFVAEELFELVQLSEVPLDKELFKEVS